MTTHIYEVFAGGKKIGITIAESLLKALAATISATSRKTSSKDGLECDYETFSLKRLQVNASSCDQVKLALAKAMSRTETTLNT